MLVVVAGAGSVGQFLLESFDNKQSDIILIEKDEYKANHIKETQDIMLVEGDMLSHFVLRSANVAAAGLFIACSNVDSVNILACQLAKRLGAKKCIARVYSEDIFPYEVADLEAHLGVDWLVSPSRLASYKIAYSLFNSEAITFDNYFASRLDIAKIIVQEKNTIVGQKLKSWLPSKNAGFVAACRNGNMIEIDKEEIKNYTPQINDTVIMSGIQNTLPKKVSSFFPNDFKNRGKIYFAGTSKAALSAFSLVNYEQKDIVVLEKNLKKAQEIEEKYEVSVIHVDSGIFENLKNLDLDNKGVFVCSSDDDADNLTYALNALDLNFQSIIPIVQGKDSIRFFKRVGLQKVISICELAAKEIFRYYRESIQEDFPLIKGENIKAFIYEITENSPLLDKSWSDLNSLGSDVAPISSWRKGRVWLFGDKNYKKSEVGDKIFFSGTNNAEKSIKSILG